MNATAYIAVFYVGFVGIAWSVWSTWTDNQERKRVLKEEINEEPGRPEETETTNLTLSLFPELAKEVKTIQPVKAKRSPLEGYDPCPGYTLWKANPDGYTPPKEEPKEPPRKKKKKK